MENRILGYKLIKPGYVNAVKALCDKYSNGWWDAHADSNEKEHGWHFSNAIPWHGSLAGLMESAGILDVWFEPVYKQLPVSPSTKIISDNVFSKIVQWAEDRNLIDGSTPMKQYTKLHEEMGELHKSLANDKCPKDDIGDMVVVLTIIAAQSGLTIEECIDYAYNEIKDRKGKMVDGVFVKEV